MKKYERIYVPKEVRQDGSVLAAAVQLERDGETSTEQQSSARENNTSIQGKAVKANIGRLQGPGAQVRQKYKHKCATNLHTEEFPLISILCKIL